jgi:phosphoglycolate phosphatase
VKTPKQSLVVLDFDGFLINSYDLIRVTFESFGLDVGDEHRFKNRRKFLKYLGGGKEFLGNLVSYSLPRKRRFRQSLTEHYLVSGRVFAEFVSILNAMVLSPNLHVGIVSRNFTLNPGATIRTVLRNSGVAEDRLDFVIPVPIGADKQDILEAMRSSGYQQCLFGGDEIGDYRAAIATGYEPIMASYGFDTARRLTEKGGVPAEVLFDTPARLVWHLQERIAPRLAEPPALLARIGSETN